MNTLDASQTLYLFEHARNASGNMTLSMKTSAQIWCIETLGYLPETQCSMGAKSYVFVVFEEPEDELLFRIRFHQHFMPQAIQLIVTALA